MGIFGGSFILTRAMNAMVNAQNNEAETYPEEIEPSEEDDQSGIILQSSDGDRPVLITTYDVSDLVEQAGHSVVGIVTESYSSFSSSGTGTGIIMDSSGYIITNCHCVMNEATGKAYDRIDVTMYDGTVYEAAEVIGKVWREQGYLMDPHTAAELSIDDIVALCDDLIEAHKGWLPEYH